jgi:hypothetical protein
MRASPVAFVLGLAGTVVVIAACAAGAVAGPLILLTNTWAEVGAEDHRFAITDDADGVASDRGTFTGTEFADQNDNVGTPIDGDWSNGRVRMTIYSNPAATWHATFHGENPDTLVFTRSVSGTVHTLRIFR